MLVLSARGARSAVMALSLAGNANLAATKSRALTSGIKNECISQNRESNCRANPKYTVELTISARKLDEISRTAEEYRIILDRLFPDQDVSSLVPLSRQELLGLLGLLGSSQEPNLANMVSSPSLQPVFCSLGFDALGQIPMELGETVEIPMQYYNGGADWFPDGQYQGYNMS